MGPVLGSTPPNVGKTESQVLGETTWRWSLNTHVHLPRPKSFPRTVPPHLCGRDVRHRGESCQAPTWWVGEWAWCAQGVAC